MNEHDGILRTNKHLVTECGEGLNNDLCVSQRITLDAHCNTTKKEKPPVSLSLGTLCCISFQSQVHTHGALTGGDFYASDYKRPLTSRLCHMLSSGPLSTLQDNREVSLTSAWTWCRVSGMILRKELRTLPTSGSPRERPGWRWTGRHRAGALLPRPGSRRTCDSGSSRPRGPSHLGPVRGRPLGVAASARALPSLPCRGPVSPDCLLAALSPHCDN